MVAGGRLPPLQRNGCRGGNLPPVVFPKVEKEPLRVKLAFLFYLGLM